MVEHSWIQSLVLQKVKNKNSRGLLTGLADREDAWSAGAGGKVVQWGFHSVLTDTLLFLPAGEMRKLYPEVPLYSGLPAAGEGALAQLCPCFVVLTVPKEPAQPTCGDLE